LRKYFAERRGETPDHAALDNVSNRKPLSTIQDGDARQISSKYAAPEIGDCRKS